MSANLEDLTPRQRREVEYHRSFAARKSPERLAPVNFDIVDDRRRRPHNAYWAAYDRLLTRDIRGLRALVPGCGFGEDAARIARLGAFVHAFDISSEVLDVARRRFHQFGYERTQFSRQAFESTDYPSEWFDFVFLVDILHHVDIPAAVRELSRVLKPGGFIVGNEVYTHHLLEGLRRSWLVDKVIYGRMKSFIYGEDTPYITEDEHKIDEREFAHVERACERFSASWFNCAVGRIVPDRFPLVQEIDQAGLKLIGRLGRIVAGRVVFEGSLRKL